MKNGRRFGSPPKPYTPPSTPEVKINLTDPDSRVLHKAVITDAPEVVLADAGYWHHERHGTHRRSRNPGAHPARLQSPQGCPLGWDGNAAASSTANAGR